MIKNIIFDFGGVILKHRESIVEEILQEIFPNSYKEALDLWEKYEAPLKTGKKSFDDFILELKNTIHTDLTLPQIKQQWVELYKQKANNVNWELLEYVKQLRKKYKVYMFTDTIDIHNEYNKRQINIDAYFDAVYRSIDERVAKIEGKGAYLHVLKKIKAKPQDCLVIDDVEKYVTMAKELEMEAILYKDNGQLKEDLARML